MCIFPDEDPKGMPNITKEGSCETDDGITVTYLYTDFGDDSEFNVDGDIEEEDYE